MPLTRRDRANIKNYLHMALRLEGAANRGIKTANIRLRSGAADIAQTFLTQQADCRRLRAGWHAMGVMKRVKSHVALQKFNAAVQ
jgi:hypothetical protein